MTNSSVTGNAYTPSQPRWRLPGSIVLRNNVQGIAAGGISRFVNGSHPDGTRATWTMPANCFNYIGAEFRVSGKFTWTEGGTSAATYNVVVGWDANSFEPTRPTKATALCTIANTHTRPPQRRMATIAARSKHSPQGATGTALVNGWGDMSIATGQALLIGFA